MQIKFFCTRWGSEQTDWNVFLSRAKEAGYDGVEAGIPATETKEQIAALCDQAARHGLLMIIQHYDTYDADFSRHYDCYAAWLEKINGLNIVRVNSQTGKDYFSFEQNKSLIDLAAKFSEEQGIEVLHETHRNKFSFAAHITRQYLTAIPYLKIVLDASHWVNVSESFLEDQQEAMQWAIARTEHIHARVGFPEGPQISDPRAPEWKEALDVHLRWWDQVIERKRKENAPVFTILPEFGPSPYMPVLPYTRQPVASQWEINLFMMKLLKERYA